MKLAEYDIVDEDRKEAIGSVLLELFCGKNNEQNNGPATNNNNRNPAEHSYHYSIRRSRW